MGKLTKLLTASTAASSSSGSSSPNESQPRRTMSLMSLTDPYYRSWWKWDAMEASVVEEEEEGDYESHLPQVVQGKRRRAKAKQHAVQVAQETGEEAPPRLRNDQDLGQDEEASIAMAAALD